MDSEDFETEIMRTAEYYIEGLGILLVGTVGFFINMTAIWRLVFRQGARKRHTFHYLLISLSVYDFVRWCIWFHNDFWLELSISFCPLNFQLHIFLSIACFALPQISIEYRDKILIHTIPYLIPLAQMTLSSSSFTTVALTVERYFSLCLPFLR